MLAACRIVLMALLAGLDMLVMRAALGRPALMLSAGVLVALLARFHMLLVVSERTLCYTKSMEEENEQTESESGQELMVTPAAKLARIPVRVAASIVVPAIIGDAGDRATKRFLEFFAATIRNKNTRMAYYRACVRFFEWCDEHHLGRLEDIEPLHVAAYIETMGRNFEKPSVKQHLAAIRMLFDWLVTGQIVATNPAYAVRGPKHVVKTGKTTVLDAEQARRLLDSIDVSTLVGLRDRALISVMTFAFVRIGAVVGMRVEDYYPKGKRWWVRLHEKGGKRHEMPAHHNLEEYLDTYIKAAGIGDAAKTPLFRSAAGRTGALTEKPMNRVDAWRMIQRRATDLGFRVKIGCHTFRATGIEGNLDRRCDS